MTPEELWRLPSTLPAEYVALARDLGLAAVAALIGGGLRRKVAKNLAESSFDRLLIPPWQTGENWARVAAERFQLSRLAGYVCKYTVWLLGAWLILQLRDYASVAAAVWEFVVRSWIVSAVAVMGLGAGQAIAGTVLGALAQGIAQHWLVASSDNGDSELAAATSRLVGVACYTLVLLPMLLIALNVTIGETASSIVGLVWSLLLRLITAGIVLLVGWFGCRWLNAEAGDDERLKRLGRVGIVFAVTLFAVGHVAGGGPALPGLGSLAVLAVLGGVVAALWPARRHAEDVVAGFSLARRKPKRVPWEGDEAFVGKIGWTHCELLIDDRRVLIPNRQVLAAADAAPREGDEASYDETEEPATADV